MLIFCCASKDAPWITIIGSTGGRGTSGPAAWWISPRHQERRLALTLGRCTQLSRTAARPVVLVGYHLGVASIVEAAEKLADKPVRGAFFVAPADLTLGACEHHDAGTLSSAPLPFPSLLVASRSDPRCSFEKASDMALAWGSHLVDAGDVGQIDPSSGHGPWPEGLMRLGWFLKRL